MTTQHHLVGIFPARRPGIKNRSRRRRFAPKGPYICSPKHFYYYPRPQIVIRIKVEAALLLLRGNILLPRYKATKFATSYRKSNIAAIRAHILSFVLPNQGPLRGKAALRAFICAFGANIRMLKGGAKWFIQIMVLFVLAPVQ